jgi:hypothetical protein
MARLSGARGSIYLADSTTKLADSYSWEYEEMQDCLDASIKNESFKRYVADVASARIRIQSFVSSATTTPLTSGMNSHLGSSVNFVLETQDNPSGFATSVGAIVIGQGFIIRSQLHVARDGILTDEIEIEVDGPLATVN